MTLLLVAATLSEIEPFLRHYSLKPFEDARVCGRFTVRVIITGAGMVPTAFMLGRELSLHVYDLAINVGIAGSFDLKMNLGEICRVTKDVFAELGAEDGDEFISIDTLGFGKSMQSESISPDLGLTEGLRSVTGITVNKVHGNELTIAKAIARFQPQIESMEGAAFFYSCEQISVPALQIRAISNYVERRDREKWDIPLAIKNLNDHLIKLMLHET